MKKVYLGLLVTLLGLSIFATAANKTINVNKANKTKLEITVNTPEKLAIEVSFGSIDIESVKNEAGNFTRLQISKFGKSTIEGYPELPVFRRLIEMPFGSDPIVEITNYREQVIDLDKLEINNLIIPTQPSQPKCGSSRQFVHNDDVYTRNEFIGNDLVAIEKVGILRGQI